MGIFRRISQLFTTSDENKAIPKSVMLRDLKDRSRREQYAENYDAALDLLQEAYDLIEDEHEPSKKLDINLSHADILIAKGDFETASFVLKEVREDSEGRHLNAPLAYSLCSLGVIEQEKGNFHEAQLLFEEARDKAEAIHTDGASGRAAAHLGDIYLLQGNASYAVYLLEDAVEKLDRSGDRELLGYFLGRLGLAQIQIGQRDQGEVRLQRGLDLAVSIKHKAYMRMLSALVAENAYDKGKYRRALAYLEDAKKLYPDPPPESDDYANLLFQMSKASLKLADAYSALQYAEQMLAIAHTLDDATLIAKAKAAIGLAKASQSSDEVIPYLQDAANAFSESEADSFKIDILRTLADAHLAADDEETGIAIYQRAITEAKQLPLDAAKAYSDLASYYAKQRQLRTALETWQAAAKHYEDANDTGRLAGTHCDIAFMYDQLGDGKMAKREYGVALEMLSRINDAETRGIILANVAAAYSSYGDVESAQDFFKESIEIAQRNQNHPAEALRRGNFGRFLALSNRPKEALTQLMQAEKRSEELDLLSQAAVIHGNIGLAYAALDDFATANEHYQSALSQLDDSDGKQWQSRIYANWGDLALAKNELDAAQDRYQQAKSLANDTSLVDVLIQSVIGLARVNIAQNELERAESDLSKITPIANRQDYQQLLATLYEAWTQLYSAQGKSTEAADAWDKAQRIRKIMRMKPIEPDWL